MKFFNFNFNFKFLTICFVSANCEKIIKNINIKSCRNCIHYKPSLYNNDFTSPLAQCEKFGNKNIITDKITYNYADLCRENEELCGRNGKYFTEEKNIESKILKYQIISNIPSFALIIFLYIYINYLIVYLI